MLDRGIYQLSKNLGVNKSYFVEKEDENGVLIRIAVPGVHSPKSIKVSIKGGRVKVHFSGNEFCEEFLYVYPIMFEFDREEAYADIEDGVLEVFIPRNLENSK